MLVFDIETGPVPDEQLDQFLPEFDESPFDLDEFDPASVKVGNLKDEKKIAEKVEAARQQHAGLVASRDERIAAAKAKHREDFVGNAALSPITGRVLAIGFCATDSNQFAVLGNSEPEMLTAFWQKYLQCRANGRKLVGHNIKNFDLPFLVRRSWQNDVDVPNTVIQKDRFWDDNVFVDTMAVWALGTRDWVSLDNLGKVFGHGGKTEGITGADFARLWHGTPEERKQAEEYLIRDVELTARVAERMGIV